MRNFELVCSQKTSHNGSKKVNTKTFSIKVWGKFLIKINLLGFRNFYWQSVNLVFENVFYCNLNILIKKISTNRKVRP